MTSPPLKRKSPSSKVKAKKAKKQKSGKKKLDAIKKARVKAAAKSGVRAKLRARKAEGGIAGIDLSAYEFLQEAKYTLFKDPGGGCPTSGGFRGCKKMTITLGPKKQFGEPGTNSTGSHPKAITKACSSYPEQDFKSGHVLNADFGGPDSNDNMTILTASANSAQRKFDSNLKKARNALYDVYSNFAKCAPKEESFFTDLDYGIEVVIVIGATGGVWDKKYPGNCISNEITLTATIINEANARNAANDDDNFKNVIPSRLKDTPRLLKVVSDLVDTANTGSPLDNREY